MDKEEMSGGSLTKFIASVKAIGEYLATPVGLGSLVPGAVAFADIGLRILPLSAAVRPYIYWIVLGVVFYGIYSECARYAITTAASNEHKKMPRRAAIHFWIFIGICVTYPSIVFYLDDNPPTDNTLLLSLLWLAAVGAAIGVMEITRSLVILGLKVYIDDHRP